MTRPPKKRADVVATVQPQHALTVPSRPYRKSEQEAPPLVLPAHVQRLHEVWLQLRGDWSWLVVVPGEAGFSTAALTQGLCQVGSRLSLAPVDFIEATNVDLDSASRLIGELGTANSSSNAWPGSAEEPASSSWNARSKRAIVALESPVSNPLALPVALAADGAVLCVRRERSRLSEVRRTVEAIGRDRIRCCILID